MRFFLYEIDKNNYNSEFYPESREMGGLKHGLWEKWKMVRIF